MLMDKNLAFNRATRRAVKANKTAKYKKAQQRENLRRQRERDSKK